MRKLLAVAVLIGLTACGDPTAPSETMTGKWTAAQVDVFFNVTLDMTEHSPTSVTGIWRGTIAGRSNQSSGRIIAGSRKGDAITLTMEPIEPCGYGGYVLEVTRSGSDASGKAYNTDCAGGKVGAAYAVTLSR